MIYELDEEFVMQMEDSLIFSWLSSYQERMISCVENSKICTGNIIAEGNAYTISKIFTDNILKKKECSESDFIIFITVSGENQNILKIMENEEKNAIVISQGGNAKRIAREKNWQFHSLPKGIPARFLFPEIIGCLMSVNGIKLDTKINGNMIESFMPSNPTESNFAKKLGYAISMDFVISVDKELRGIRRRIEDMTIQNVNYIPRIIWKDQLDLYLKSKDEKGIIEINENKIKIEDPLEKFSDSIKNIDLFNLINLLDFATVYLAIIKKHDVPLFDNHKE